MMGDDPPFLAVGTEVSAKYKGAFCEAKVRKVVKSIKCKVIFKLGLGSAVVSDEQIRGLLRVGAQVEAKHPEKNQYSEGIISKIQDCSQYTVVFDDGDITTLRRTALCLKSGRHFAESETLDQLPLTHPEHFGTPVVGGRRGRRRQDESTDEEGEEGMEPGRKEKSGNSRRNEEREPDIGKIVCVEVSDKKKSKDPWFPGLVVAPTAQDAVPIRVKDEYLVRSFKDGRYYTVPKKEALEFTREFSLKAENGGLKSAVEKAVQYLDRDELPAHWDREVLFGLDDTSSVNESKTGSDIDSSDDETREEKDHFVAQLYKFMDDRGTPINKGPTFNNRDLDLYRLFNIVHKLGGFNRVTNQNAWKTVTQKMIPGAGSSSANLLKQAYKKYLHGFEEFYRKLGCTMNSPRGSKSRSRPGRSLIRDRDKAMLGSSTPKREPDVEMEEPKTELVDDEREESEEKEVVTPRRRSLPTRLLEDKKKAKDEESDHENESSSGQSGRSQRGTRSRKIEEDPPEVQRGRKRQKSKQEEKNNDEDDKPTLRIKARDDTVSNGKEENEKKGKVTLKENKPKGRKSEDAKVNCEDIKKQNVEEDPNPPPKRRGRKPKALADSEDILIIREDGGRLPLYVDVQIGDKLKVYYGPTQDSTVTYEAKVCEIRNEGVQKLYLVHYTGWNTRYDEWIKRVRIAENLSWSPARKRSKSANAATTRSGTTPCTTRPFPGKRGRTKGQDSSRSATPSSVTSTSSAGQRNASSITGEDHGNKVPPLSENRRRCRRESEISVASAGSEASSEEDDDASRPRKGSSKKQTESEETEAVEVEELPVEETTVRRRRRKLPVEKESSDAEESQVENKHSSESASDVSTVPTPTRRGRRRAQPIEVPVEPSDEKESVNVDNTSQKDLNKVSGEPKGKDFDLKKIRSELKMPVDITPTIASSAVHSNVCEVPPTTAVVAASAPTESIHSTDLAPKGNEEDIYEFREPEPFEFEVRTRRESPFNEDRVGRFPRKQIKDEDEEEEANNSKKPLPTTNSSSIERVKSPANSPPKMRPTIVTPSAIVTSAVPPVIVAEVVVPQEPVPSITAITVAEADIITQVPTAPTAANTPVIRSVSPAPPSPPVPAIVSLPVIIDPPPSESLVIPKVLTLQTIQLPSPVSVPAPTAHVMPALSVLAARSIVSLPQPTPSVVENKEPEEKEVVTPSQVEESKVKTVVKRERRKTNKKAISREFIESDDDSQDAIETVEQIQEPAPQAIEEKPLVKEEVVIAAEDVQNDDVSIESAKEENAIKLRRTSVGSNSRLKTEDDLEESSLLCEETIPGSPVTHSAGPNVDCAESSPAPSTSASVEMPFASAPVPSNPPRTRGLGGTGFGSRAHRKRGLRETLAMQRPIRGSASGSAAVMDNTPPTTPEGSLSSSSNSPDGEHGGLSPDHESSAKSEREFSENDIEVGSVPVQHHPIHVPTRNVGPRASATLATIHSQSLKRRDEDVNRDEESPVKRRRRGAASDHVSRRGRGYGRSPRRTGSDSEDTVTDYLSSSAVTNSTSLTSYQPRSTRYNFCEDLDPELDASQRIAILQDKLKELRQTYMALKAQVALIDRRKKKLKRKEKEEKSKDCTNS